MWWLGIFLLIFLFKDSIVKKYKFIKDHQIKFSYYVNNKRIKISLKDQEVLHIYSFTPDEEGYSSEQIKLKRDNSKIFLYIIMEGRDCDGPLKQYYTAVCLQKNLRKGYKGTPLWETINKSQIDTFAESMNY